MSLRARLPAAALGAAILMLAVALATSTSSSRTADPTTGGLAAAPVASPSEPIVAELPPAGDPIASVAPAAAAPVATLPPVGSIRGPGDAAKPATGATDASAAARDPTASATSPTTLAGMVVLIVIALTSLVGGAVAAARGRR